MEDSPGPAMVGPPPVDPAGLDDGPASMPLGDVADARSAASRPRETEEGRGGEHCADGETGGDPPARPDLSNPDGDGCVVPCCGKEEDDDDAMPAPGQPSSEAGRSPRRSLPTGPPPQPPQHGGDDWAIAVDDGGDSFGKVGGSLGEEEHAGESASDDDDVVEMGRVGGRRCCPADSQREDGASLPRLIGWSSLPDRRNNIGRRGRRRPVRRSREIFRTAAQRGTREVGR
mmetsp:Transcript_1631/g.3478  ORF Transcript_1631/g.3478 Transcript_1631/m.3478 type:complete len:230 (+) Transcript_1631:72-761(+)